MSIIRVHFVDASIKVADASLQEASTVGLSVGHTYFFCGKNSPLKLSYEPKSSKMFWRDPTAPLDKSLRMWDASLE